MAVRPIAEIEDVTERHRRTTIRSNLYAIPGAILATVTVMSIVWKVFLSGFLVGAVKNAVAGDLREEVAKAVTAQVAPLERKIESTNAGFAAIIQSTIATLERDIARLEYVRDYQRDQWTSDRAEELVDKTQQLTAQRAALSAIRTSSRN